MRTYTVQISGSSDLSEIIHEINGEESDAAEFVESELSLDETSNLVKFRTLPSGKRPKPLILVPQGEKAPPGKRLIWDGEMVVSGEKQYIDGYRGG